VQTHPGPVTFIVGTLISIIGTGTAGRIKTGICYFITLVVTIRSTCTGVYKRMKNAASPTTLVISITENTVIAG
jgi:hypothetical protein